MRDTPTPQAHPAQRSRKGTSGRRPARCPRRRRKAVARTPRAERKSPGHGARHRPSCCRLSTSGLRRWGLAADRGRAERSWHLSHLKSTLAVTVDMSNASTYNRGSIASLHSAMSPQSGGRWSHCQFRRKLHQEDTLDSTHCQQSTHRTSDRHKYELAESCRCPCMYLGSRSDFGKVGARLPLPSKVANHRCQACLPALLEAMARLGPCCLHA